jgi:hypothetical protein
VAGVDPRRRSQSRGAEEGGQWALRETRSSSNGSCRIARSLVPGGYLFLGHAETLRGLSQDFHLVHTHGTFYHQRKREGDEAPARHYVDVGALPAQPVMPAAPSGRTRRHSSRRIPIFQSASRSTPKRFARHCNSYCRGTERSHEIAAFSLTEFEYARRESIQADAR